MVNGRPLEGRSAEGVDASPGGGDPVAVARLGASDAHGGVGAVEILGSGAEVVGAGTVGEHAAVAAQEPVAPAPGGGHDVDDGLGQVEAAGVAEVAGAA